jgi:hypothetical protein
MRSIYRGIIGFFCVAALAGLLIPPPVVAEDVVSDELLEVPPPKAEVITPEPSSEYVWIPGYWERDPGTWTWIKGHWDKPPDNNAHWKPGYWVWQEGKWHWNRGHWEALNTEFIVPDALAIPETLDEIVPPKPSSTDSWVPGYWEWDGTWIWMPGYWTTKPDPNAVWVVGQWEKYDKSGWRWIGGHWEVK